MDYPDSKFDTRARGAAILISRKVQFTPTETISDSNGCYVIVMGSLFQTPVILVSVYALNWDDVHFMKNLLSSLPNLNTHYLILGGDMNCVIDLQLNTCTRTVLPSKLSRALSSFMDQCGCIDPWRFLHPVDKQFSFFSHIHHSYTCIDNFFIHKTLLLFLVSDEYSAIAIYDHAPVALELTFKTKPKETCVWRLDSALLFDAGFCNVISTNRNNETSP